MAILIRIFLLFALLGIGLAPEAMAAESLQLHEQEIKAGLLYNFLKYIDWPASTVHNSSIAVCIFGSDPFDGYLQPMEGRTVNQRVITLRHIHNAREAGECNLLFVNSGEKDHWPDLRNALAGKSVLTISDFEGFAAGGGMIEFGHKDNHISADLNVDAVAAGNLHVQDRLLRLVSVVHTREGKWP